MPKFSKNMPSRVIKLGDEGKNKSMQKSRKERISLLHQMDLLISVITAIAWPRGSATTDGQLAQRWTVYLSRKPFAERRPCTGHLRGPPRALRALTRPVCQPRRGCQHGGRRRCRLSALIPARVSAEARGAAKEDNGVLLKAILTRRTFKPGAEG